MMYNWDPVAASLTVHGTMRAVAAHHHPAVQVTMSFGRPVEVRDAVGIDYRSLVIDAASGVRVSMISDGESRLTSIYLGAETPQGAALDALCRHRGHNGVWAPGEPEIMAAVHAAAQNDTHRERTEEVLLALTGLAMDTAVALATNRHLTDALALLAASLPQPVALASVASTIGVSPDHLGRLFKQQLGVPFTSAVRWARLMIGLTHCQWPRRSPRWWPVQSPHPVR